MGTYLNSLHTNSYQNSNNMAAIFYIYSQIYKKTPYITPRLLAESENAYITPRLLLSIKKCIHNSSEFAYITPRLLPESKNAYITQT
jgi:hypothetical protein